MDNGNENLWEIYRAIKIVKKKMIIRDNKIKVSVKRKEMRKKKVKKSVYTQRWKCFASYIKVSGCDLPFFITFYF